METAREFVKWNKAWPNPTDEIPNIILDTDIGPDYDDTGAVVMLHNYANKGKVNLLGLMCCVSAPFGAPYLSILNKYYGRPSIPIGTLKSKDNILPSCRGVNFTISQFSEYDSDILDGTHARDAVEVYREILSASEDNSVTIVTIGMLSNLCDLLKSTPDKYSDLAGAELVAKKVKFVSTMAGLWPNSPHGEFNVIQDIESADYVINNWPTPIIFSGYEIGVRVRTGNRLSETQIDSPLRGGYHADMSSWDLTSVMYAVEGIGDYWDIVRGDAYLEGGSNRFIENEANGARAYLVEKMDPELVADILENYMLETKKNNPDEIKTQGIDSADTTKIGNWEIYAPHTYYHNGSTLKCTEPDCSLEAKIFGSGIDIYGGISPQNGKIAVYIDNSLAKEIDTYSEKTIDTICLYSNRSLKKSDHTIKIVTIENKNPLSNGNEITIDFFKVIDCK